MVISQSGHKASDLHNNNNSCQTGAFPVGPSVREDTQHLQSQPCGCPIPGSV